jgi:hypothetical protein
MKKLLTSVSTAAALIVLTQAAWAEDYWNDAVVVSINGKRQVELPPVNRNVSATVPRPPVSWTPPAAGLTHVMEGPEGLVECVTNDYRNDGRCNSFTPGQYQESALRVWIVKRNGAWWQCSDPRTRNMCERSASQCTGDPKSADRCYPLRPSFGSWLPPAKTQR